MAFLSCWIVVRLYRMTTSLKSKAQLNHSRVTLFDISVELRCRSNALMRGDVVVAGKMLDPFLTAEVS